MTEPIVFFNIGWMEHYDGVTKEDYPPQGGGQYNHENIGHEACNFSKNKNLYYGYVQPRNGTILLENLGASKKDDEINGVTIFWTATLPEGGTVIIGWYRNATIYRKFQTIPNPNPKQKKHHILHYIASAKTSDAVLLPVSQRVVMIKRNKKGGMGQSNVWYAKGEKSQEYRKAAINQLLKYECLELDALLLESEQETPEDLSPEGRRRLVQHYKIERNTALIRKKKKTAKSLSCEVCEFNFKEKYHDLGEGFCEVHHRVPLSEIQGEVNTTLADLAIVCSNCHRMLHKTKPALTVEELKQKLESHK